MSNSHLTIEIAGQEIRFSSIVNNAVSKEATVLLSSSDYSESKKELDAFIELNSFISSEYDETILSEASNKSSLVPNNVFAESSPQAIYKLCFGECANDFNIEYNRIAEHSIVNVYSTRSWTKRYFVMKFPRVTIQNEGTHILRKILNENAFYLKATVILHKDNFQLTIVKHNQLEYYSFFDYQNHEDVLYHLLFALQQKEMTDESGTLEIVKALGCEQQTIDSIQEDLKRIKDLKQLKLSLPEHFIPKSQLLCV